jgi:hypothetical protein
MLRRESEIEVFKGTDWMSREGTNLDKLPRLSSSLLEQPPKVSAMKYFVRPLVFRTLCAALCVAFPSAAQNPAPPEAPPPAPTAPQTPAKKVWTNENISSAQGTVSGGGSRTSSGRSSRSPAVTSNGASFINPKEGQIVQPGESIHIDLEVDSGITLAKGVAIISPMGFSNEVREGPPYSFTFTVPDKDLTQKGPATPCQDG